MKTASLAINYLNNPVTLILISIVVVVKLLEARLKKLRFRLLLHPYSIVRNKEYYRLVTSDFVHHDWIHLLINGFFMYIYAGYLEDYLNHCGKFGSLEFIIIYLSSCLAGTVMVTIRHKKDFGFTSGGASASIIGCLFSYVILQPNRIAFFLPVFGPVTNLYFGFLSIIVIFIYQKKTGNSLINYEQHFYGALGGIIITLVLFPVLAK